MISPRGKLQFQYHFCRYYRQTDIAGKNKKKANMHWLDILILTITLALGVLGFFNGLISQLSTPLAIVAGVVCAWYGQPWLEAQMAGWFDKPLALAAVAVVAAFLGGALVVKVLAAIIRAKIGENESRFADRSLGAVFGLLKGLALSAVFVMLIGNYGKRELMKESVGAPALYATAQWVVDEVRERELWNRACNWTTSKGGVSEKELQSMIQELNGDLMRAGMAEANKRLAENNRGTVEGK